MVKNHLHFVSGLLHKHIQFPTSLCEVLVFRLDPAAPVPAPAAPLHPTTHHTTTHHILLITFHSSHHISHLTYKIAHHISLITSLITSLLTPRLSHLSSYLAHHISLITPHLRRTTQSLLAELHTEHPGGAAARVAAAGPRLPFVWQAQYTEPRGGAAHRASWRSHCSFQVNCAPKTGLTG